MTAQAVAGAKPEDVYIHGMVLGAHADGSPVLFHLEDRVQLPLFRDETQLTEFFAVAHGPGVVFVKVVDDPRGLLTSIPGDIEIVLEPHVGADGLWQYRKVLRD